MKYRIITDKEDLTTELRNAGFVESITVYDGLNGLKNIVEDVLIIDAAIVKIEDLSEIYDTNLPKIYLIEEKAKITNSDLENLHIVEHRSTPEKTVQFLEKYIANDLITLTNVICFRGTTRHVGTTMIAESIAQYVNNNTDMSVALLSFTLTKGLEYNGFSPMSLDSILSRVEAKILTEESIKKELAVTEDDAAEDETKNIYYMQGFNEITEYDSIKISEIITIASKAFDLVILDLGGMPTRMMQPLLKKAKSSYVITTPNIKAISEFNSNGVEQQLNISEYKVIVNKNGLYNGYSKTYMKNNFDFDVIGVLPNSAYAFDAEIEYKPLINYDDYNYKKAFVQLSRNIAYDNGIRMSEKDKRR